MFCSKCGFKLKEDENFCPKCGTQKREIIKEVDKVEKSYDNEFTEVIPKIQFTTSEKL